jgi:signal transduction histidine kinase
MAPQMVKIESRYIDLPNLCRAIAEASPIPMLAVAGVGDIIQYVNPAFCVLATQVQETLIGKAFSDAIPAGHDCLALLDRVHRTAHAETHIGDEQCPHSLYWSYAMWPAVTPDGEIIGILIQVTESSAAHQRTAAMNQALIISSLRQHEMTEKAEALNVQLHAEVVDRKRAEEELRRANEDLQRFTHVASHDLQEPLRTVTAYTQLLARQLGATLDGEAEMLVGQILQGSTRMSALIRDLLAYARLGTGEGPGTAPVDCGEVVKAAIANLEGSISEAHAAVTVDEPLPWVAGSSSALIQLFQNVIGNALKYRRADARPEIYISADHHDGECTISVRDNGIGFKQQYGEQIFGVFKRLHGAAYPGTGIGLAICKRIVELHGGRIWATGEEGRGATFFFSLHEASIPPGASLLVGDHR